MHKLTPLVILMTVSVAAFWLMRTPVIVYSQDANSNGIADRMELPGTQASATLPGAAFNLATPLKTADECTACHFTGTKAKPFAPWSGSMMGNSARDPVFWAQLDVAENDESSDPNLAGARDICLRCHIPKGWLEGRSSGAPGPALSNALRGMAMQEKDLFGVQCELCHRLVDRDATTADGIDQNMIVGLNSHADSELRVPPSYGNGMYVVDRYDVRRGPFGPAQIAWDSLIPKFLVNPADWPPDESNNHPLKHSAFVRSGNLCGTCHDVSNPVWTPGQPKGNAQLNFPIERTWTEWTHSAYSAQGEAGNCQSCHMNGALNGVISGAASSSVGNSNQHLNDIHVHDFTGGNVWIPRFIAAMVQRFQNTKDSPDPGLSPVIGGTQAQRDAFLEANYARALKALYPAGAFWETSEFQLEPLNFAAASYADASVRTVATLQRAAELSATRQVDEALKVRVWNMTGHKLPTGYPEGRRMWLDVRFLNVNPASGTETLEGQSGEYNADTGELYHDFNMNDDAGPRAYDVVTYTNGSGAPIAFGRRTQVYEARMHHMPSGTEFHFIKNNERVSDNRIPPLGWIKALYQANNAEQVIAPAYTTSQMEYHDSVSGPVASPPVIESTHNFDEVPYPVPGASDIAEIRLQYQSVSKEYVEELVAASPRTLLYPAAGGANAFSRGDILEHAWRTFDFDLNGDAMPDNKKKVPPVEMRRLRVALVDTDQDGLSDDWETAFGLNPNDPNGDRGRNGDLDGDGRSNYAEFQAATNPNAADAVRGAVDLVLVLDFSGSMNDPAPTSGAPKIEVLKDAVDLFLTTWKQYAVRTDRIGVVYFSSDVTVEGGGLIDFATLPLGTTIETRINDLIAAIRARSASNATAMGGGLQRALNLLQGGAPGRRKQVIVFTNGMQNSSPMVRADMGGNYRILSEPVSFADGVFGDSGVTDAGGPAFGTLLNSLGTRIHTIGIGVAQTADDRWLRLISDIASNTSALSQFISRPFELEGAFLNNLVASLRGFSPQILAEEQMRLEPETDSQTKDLTLDLAATKSTFILSWAGPQLPGRLEFDLLAPDGSNALPLLRITDGPQYRIATAYFPLAKRDGRPVSHTGNWKMVVRRAGHTAADPSNKKLNQQWREAVDYRVYLIADIPHTDFDVAFGKSTYRAGEEVTLHVAATESTEPVRSLGLISAVVTKASVNFGDLISKERVDPGKIERALNTGSDLPTDRAEAKFRLALADPGFAGRVQPTRETIKLFDDGNAAHADSLPDDGVYSARLGRARVPGLVAADISLTGQSARSRDFSRRYEVSTVVRHARFDRGYSNISASRLGSRDGKWLVALKVKPTDAKGNSLGPGFRDRLTIEVPGFPADSVIQDDLNGSYTRNFLIPFGSMGTNVKIAFEQELIYAGSVRGAFLRGWIWTLLWILVFLTLIVATVWLMKRYFRHTGPSLESS
ncbi:MAG TPA: VWA domain-containing protein [Pyrinomonadaceae bacterium]|nr:VWA domain-containing protein [Pyrinomonadaceae bacterium]